MWKSFFRLVFEIVLKPPHSPVLRTTAWPPLGRQWLVDPVARPRPVAGPEPVLVGDGAAAAGRWDGSPLPPVRRRLPALLAGSGGHIVARRVDTHTQHGDSEGHTGGTSSAITLIGGWCKAAHS